MLTKAEVIGRCGLLDVEDDIVDGGDVLIALVRKRLGSSLPDDMLRVKELESTYGLQVGGGLFHGLENSSGLRDCELDAMFCSGNAHLRQYGMARPRNAAEFWACHWDCWHQTPKTIVCLVYCLASHMVLLR